MYIFNVWCIVACWQKTKWDGRASKQASKKTKKNENQSIDHLMNGRLCRHQGIAYTHSFCECKGNGLNEMRTHLDE